MVHEKNGFSNHGFGLFRRDVFLLCKAGRKDRYASTESKRIPGTRRQAHEEPMSTPIQYGLFIRAVEWRGPVDDALTQINCSTALTYRGSPRSWLANWFLSDTFELVMEEQGLSHSTKDRRRRRIGKL
ncbi:hypothetical protein E1B28_000196 [Marasmius oreades]|uniref:Uncharacterized protein n=1 Tax=Marasmius oreades TaxID=181124 RepID=A0A9P7V0T3_9AGAR|nr:uncharacterized protein E1B28_000196 [Marasmius oreades]KAG7098229.1 hypothetical protein E1B28_000196 [Marasmius oreades]